MASEISAIWSGFPGGPGISKFYTETPPTGADLTIIRTFFLSVASQLPGSCNIDVLGSGDIFNPATGELTGGWVATQPVTVDGLSGNAYAGQSGAVVTWRTITIVNGRRVLGRTFMVPLVGVYDNSGTLDGGFQTNLAAAAQTMINDLAGNLKVWHRPTSESPGSLATIVNATVPDLAATLRSRRS